MGKKENAKRMNDTLEYINGIPGILPAARQALVQQMANDMEAAQEISLGGWHIMHGPEKTARRHALRAVLLCLYWSDRRAEITAAKHSLANTTEEVLRETVKSFFPLENVDANDVIQAARDYQPGIGGLNYPAGLCHYSRGAVTSGRQSLSGNCYSAVAIWLYLGGAVSLRWLLTHGMQPALDLPVPWVWGTATRDPKAAFNTPGGMICRFAKSPKVGGGLHYALSVSKAICVGVNQSADITKEWVGGEYGLAPTLTYSRFSIAGYLATMQQHDREAALRTCPCMPIANYRF